MTIDRYTKTILTALDQWVRPELSSADAQYRYNCVRQSLARLAFPAKHGALADFPSSDKPSPNLDEVQAIYQEASLIENREAAIASLLGVTGLDGPRTEGLSASQLVTYLRSTGAPEAGVSSFQPLAGGRSKQTILVNLKDVTGLPEEIVIRRDARAVTGTSVANEFGLVLALADRGLPVPRPYRLVTNNEILGTPAMFMEHLPGRLVGGIFDPPETPGQALELAKVLGQIAAIPLPEIEQCLAGWSSPHSFEVSASEIEDFKKDWTVNGRSESAAVNFAARWLQDNLPKLSKKRSLVHGGALFHNILFDGDRLTGLLDWESAGTGHPAWDVGNVKTSVTNLLPWNEFVQAYQDAGGASLTPLEIDWFALYTTMSNIKILHRLRNAFEDGKTDDLGIMELSLVFLPRFLERLSLAVRAVLAA